MSSSRVVHVIVVAMALLMPAVARAQSSITGVDRKSTRLNSSH